MQMGFTLKEIGDSLSQRRYDEVCATFMLLKRKSGSPTVVRDHMTHVSHDTHDIIIHVYAFLSYRQ